MKELKAKVFFQLAKNSRKSDRNIAQTIPTSQPTATRIRTELEKEGYITQYGALPSATKLGFNVMAVTLLELYSDKMPQTLELEPLKTIRSLPEVVLSVAGTGFGYDIAIISLHQNFATYDDFLNQIRDRISNPRPKNLQSFLIDLQEQNDEWPFTFQVLYQQLLNSAKDQN